MEPDNPPASTANIRKNGPALVMLFLLIGYTAYVLLQFA